MGCTGRMTMPLVARSICGGLLSLGILMPAPRAMAQSSDDPIIVTARKREEDLQRVPVVAAVLQAEDLDRRQITDLYGVASLVPGLVLGDAPLEVGTEISLRGIGSSPLDPGVDQSVALNLDGLPLGQGIAYSVGLFDVERVEVLKGPQPLFFGKNNPGGVIAIRSADPGDRAEVMTRAGFEPEASEWQGQFAISGPVTETLGLRLASQYTSGDGYFRNTASALPESGARQPQRRFGENRSIYARLTGLFEPSSGLTARLKINRTHDRVLGGLAEQLVFCLDGTFNYLPAVGLDLPSQYSANEDCRADRDVNIVDMDPARFPGIPNDGVSFTETDQLFGTLEAAWTVTPSLTLTSVTGYYHLTVEALQNGPWSGGAAPPLAITKALGREELTQELRLVSDLGGLLDYTAGIFLQDGQITNDIVFLGNAAYGLPAVAVKGSHDIDVRSVALFGQLRARPMPELEIAAGVRWTDEKRSNAPVTYDVLGIVTGVQGAPLYPSLPKVRSRNWSPELTVSWSPETWLTAFGALKQGYKSGSYNINQALNPGDDNSFGDERGRGGEIGLKGHTPDRELNFDLAGYYYQYHGLQVGIIRITSAGIPVLATVNAAAAETYGTDMALQYRPRAVAGLSLSAAVNWNHGYFTRFANADCKPGQTVAEGCNLLPVPVTNPDEIAAGYYSIDPVLGVPVRYNSQDLSGTRLHRAPALQANIAVDYELPLRGGLQLGLGGDLRYSSGYNIDLGNRRSGWQDSFGKVGAHVRLGDPEERWEVALIGNNLTNRLTTGGCLTVNYPGGGGVFPGIITGAPVRGPAGSGETLCGYERGRELWLRLTIRP